jgi:hypothetical protein
MTFIIILFWIAFAIAVGMFASIRRDRNGIGWFVLALTISPLLAFTFVAILKEKFDEGPSHKPASFWDERPITLAIDRHCGRSPR